jgi:hypothetical protein
MIDTGLNGKKVIVDGANHRIGAAIAIAFAREGARVLISFCAAKAKAEGAVCFLCLIFLILNLSGCAGPGVIAGAWGSGRPIYPGSWPALDTGSDCPNLSGKYRAISEEAAPLAYAAGEHPREMFFFLTYGKPLPVPPLGRRVLSWHLTGVLESRDLNEWNSLTAYADALEAEVLHSDSQDWTGWVELQEMAEGAIEVRAGLHDKTFLKFVLRKEGQSLWAFKSHVYECKEGGISVVNTFPAPPEEKPTGQNCVIAAKFTFFRATDGSLVALEEPHAYTGPAQGSSNMLFKKWWRWQRIE